MLSIVLELPYPPSINHYYVRTIRGMMIGAKGQAYRKEVSYILMEGRNKPLQGDIGITIETFPPDKRIRDIDNVLKALLDALQHGGAYENDNQICELHIKRGKVQKRGAVLIEISELA